MSYSLKDKIEDADEEIAPWGSCPVRNIRCIKRLKKDIRKQSPEISLSTPYRPRSIQSRQPSNERKTIVNSIFFEVPKVSNAFPVRPLGSPARVNRKNFSRSKSYVNDDLSISDIENIERIQKLKPYKALNSNLKSMLKRENFVNLANEIFYSKVVKDRDYAGSRYKKYVRQL